jgi:hypothetical protein
MHDILFTRRHEVVQYKASRAHKALRGCCRHHGSPAHAAKGKQLGMGGLAQGLGYSTLPRIHYQLGVQDKLGLVCTQLRLYM